MMLFKRIFNLGLLISLAILAPSCAQKSIVLKNTATIDRENDYVIVNRTQLSELVGEIPSDKVPVAYLNNAALPSQADDLDGDGSWDELIFLVSIKAEEETQIIVKFVSPDKVPAFEKKTNVRFASKEDLTKDLTSGNRLKTNDSPSSSKAFQMEGPGWENDVVAFRNYFDTRNGIDIFGKRTEKMVLDSVGIYGQNYHELSWWGMDILKVANSLGAGAAAYKLNDSIYRLGTPSNGTFELVVEGPVRSIFRFNFSDWAVQGQTFSATQEIQIIAGTNYFISKVEANPIVENSEIVTGLVNLHADTCYQYENDAVKCFATHDAQAFTGEYLAIAILVDKNELISSSKAPESGDGITKTFLVNLKNEEGTPATYRLYSCWELQDEGFKDKAYFDAFIEKEINLAANPIEILK